VTYKAASFYAKTVEIQPHELPPPPSASEKVRSALSDALRYAPELGSEMVDAIGELLKRTRRAA
jgi:hypothetical protein